MLSPPGCDPPPPDPLFALALLPFTAGNAAPSPAPAYGPPGPPPIPFPEGTGDVL